MFLWLVFIRFQAKQMGIIASNYFQWFIDIFQILLLDLRKIQQSEQRLIWNVSIVRTNILSNAIKMSIIIKRVRVMSFDGDGDTAFANAPICYVCFSNIRSLKKRIFNNCLLAKSSNEIHYLMNQDFDTSYNGSVIGCSWVRSMNGYIMWNWKS